MKEIIYDLEVMPNIFLAGFYDPARDKCLFFEMSPFHNHYHMLIQYLEHLKKQNVVMVGFNNYSYDYPVLHSLLHLTEDRLAVPRAWKKSCDIIGSMKKGDRFVHVIWDRDMYIPQLDLFKLHHFDNKAKTVSLKRLEFNMRRKDIVEYTEGFDHMLTSEEEIRQLKEYNRSDLLATAQFRQMSEEAVSFRETLIPEFGIEVLNYNDTKIGEKLIQKRLEEQFGLGALYDFEENEFGVCRRKPKQSFKEYVDLKDIVFDRVFQFEVPVFQKVFQFMKTLRIFILGARYEWSDKPDYLKMQKLIERCKVELDRLDRKSKAYKELKEQIAKLKEIYQDYNISVVHDDVSFEFGKGGLHAARPWSAFRATEEYKIVDVDVASFYPSIAIEYRMHPEHLPMEFTDIYGALKRERILYKKTDPARAKMLKLALNGTYGKTNSVYSMLYDPEYSLRTVINGQLMLLMLWDMLTTSLSTVKLIQANTDGITYWIANREIQAAQEICVKWERMTRMELEFTEYQSMFVRDVNNYVALGLDGKIKAKGAYNWSELYRDNASGIAWYKNHSAVIIPMAATEALVHGEDVGNFIRSHDNVYDFFACTNVNRSSRLLWGNDEVQRNTRYLVSKEGKNFTKIMPPTKSKPDLERAIRVNAGQNVTPWNTVESSNASDYDIDYDWYIAEALKLIEGFNSSPH